MRCSLNSDLLPSPTELFPFRLSNLGTQKGQAFAPGLQAADRIESDPTAPSPCSLHHNAAPELVTGTPTGPIVSVIHQRLGAANLGRKLPS